MSKIGRKPISFSSAKVEIDGNKILINGPKAKFVHELSDSISAKIEGNEILLSLAKDVRGARAQWGLQRALLANKVKGAETGFEQRIKIVGLGYKAQVSGKKMVLSLGYSHKIDYVLPEGVTVETDKTGQKLLVKSHDKNLLGDVCDDLKSFKRPEPYKGTGIMKEEERIRRKAGKTGV